MEASQAKFAAAGRRRPVGPRLAGPLGLALLLAGLFGVGACSLLFDGELHEVGCEAEGALGPPACPEGHACRGGICAAIEPVRLGSACERDDACAPGDLCLDASVFGPVGAGGEPSSPRRCSRLCCSSGECGEPEEGFVCATLPGAARGYCRPAGELGRPAGGKARAGETCASAAACRSGICEEAICRDACCADVNCAASGTACRLDPSGPAAPEGFACGAAGPYAKPYLAPCAEDGECASGLCLSFGAMGSLCSAACCGSAACGSVNRGGVSSPVACAYVAREKGVVRACARVLPAEASGPVGAPCEDDGECRGGLCVEAPGSPAGARRICSDACCLDASCGDPGFVCRPGAPGGLRCEPK